MNPYYPRLATLCLLLLLPLLISPRPLSAAGSTAGQVQPQVSATDQGLLRMSDNFFILYDPSTTMDRPYRDTGLNRIAAQRRILTASNATLPELGWQVGLYPHWKGGLWLHGSPQAFKPYYPLKRYQQSALAAAIAELPITPQGPPMLQAGLMKLEHLLGLGGRTEIFIFTDGKASTFPELELPPLEQARKLATRFDLCFTVIDSSSDPEGRELVEALGAVNSCSQVMAFDTVYDHPEHLFGKLFMNTTSAQFSNLLFDFDRAEIRPQEEEVLARLGSFLEHHPQSYAVLSGFTDNIGTEAYNIRLSKRRAERVRSYLLNRFQLKPERILLYWYGYAEPVASNSSTAGRALNRRVTISLRSN
ncbi:OmpA family protein [Desulfogranum mediterraneum]|uniref:OmpA family protein n=1 Tax=Desulfogranum mediterraneum TaxID=160661 RepID=UPI00040D84A2|nr:OmpA family protein [Desulfogranum mediterraneum]